MPGWTNLENLIYEEIIQRGQEGCDISGMKELHSQCAGNKEKLMDLYEKLCALKIKSDFPYNEPNDYNEINKLLDGYAWENSEEITSDKFLGAWLGRCAGCALGKPVEGYPYMGGGDGRKGFESVKLWFSEYGEWPISFYTPIHSPAEEKYGLRVGCPASTRENIKFMETDDDIRYTVLGLVATEQWGANFTPFDIGNLWYTYLPYNMVCTAEKQAYINYANASDETDLQKKLCYTREYLNPYREWIGAQIRVDSYGYAAAGNPLLAAKMAYNDAAFSHVKNGIYGAMFFSAVIAAAFGEREKNREGLLRCIKAGLSVIPKTSRLYADINRAVDIAGDGYEPDRVMYELWNTFGDYSGVHTNNNAALCAASLLLSDGDYEKAITNAVYGGWDTDCNGATVGSIMGALLGASALPEKWIVPLNDTLYSAVWGFHPIKISDCAERSWTVYNKIKRN